jgi:Acetyltransferases, including N-acetylases of ribosomal proteins
MNIRIAETNDMKRIFSVLESGREFLQSQELSQWQNGYSPSQYVEEDIANSWGYVLISQENEICGYATLIEEADNAYSNIRDGCWDDSHEKYVAIHGVAIDADFRGKGFAELFMQKLIETAESLGCRDIRIDTHPLNEIMQKVILRAGFSYRGMVEFDIPDGNRRAYQLIR